jgi:trigger factor
LDIQLEQTSTTEGLIKVKLNEADYQNNYQQKLKEYAKSANLKGFRPGKVPPGLIKKMYGASILVEEVNKLLVDGLRNYIQKNDVKTIGEPLPNEEKAKSIDWETQKDFEFEYEIGLVPEFDLKTDFKITRYQIKIDDKELNEQIEKLKKQYGKVEQPEKSEAGDSIYGQLIQESNEFSKETAIYTDKVDKKMAKKFVGLTNGDSVTFDIQKLFADNHDLAHFVHESEEEAKKLKGEFTFEVKDISRNIPAELNQELFDKIFGKDEVKTEKEFKEKYRETLAKNHERDSDYLLSRDIQKELLDKTKIETPDGFYKKWILRSSSEISEEELDKDFEHYIRDLKWSLIKDKISEEHDIKVVNDEVIEKTKELFRAQFGGSASPEMEAYMDQFANNYLQQENGQNYMNIYNTVRTDKVIDKLKETLKITDKKVTKADFEKKIEN